MWPIMHRSRVYPSVFHISDICIGILIKLHVSFDSKICLEILIFVYTNIGNLGVVWPCIFLMK